MMPEVRWQRTGLINSKFMKNNMNIHNDEYLYYLLSCIPDGQDKATLRPLTSLIMTFIKYRINFQTFHRDIVDC